MKRTHKRTHTHVLHRSNNMMPIRKPITSIAAVFAFSIHRTLSGTRFRFRMIRVSTNIIECRIAQTQLTDGIYAAEQNIWNVRTLTLVHGSASDIHPNEHTTTNINAVIPVQLQSPSVWLNLRIRCGRMPTQSTIYRSPQRNNANLPTK